MSNYKIILLGILLYLLLFGNLELSFSTKNTKYKLKYNGIIWLALDWYSIIRHSSNDEMKSLIEFKTTKLI